jgi:hypothetical protein
LQALPPLALALIQRPEWLPLRVNLALWAQWAALRLKAEWADAVCQIAVGRIPSRIPVNIPIHHQAEAASFRHREEHLAEVAAEQWDAPALPEAFRAEEE